MNKRAPTHYLLVLLVMSFYGGQVCPFLESLTFLQLTLPIAVMLAIQFLLRQYNAGRIERRLDPKHQSARLFQTEWLLFLLSGLLLTAFNSATYGFPLVSGLKLVVGLGVLGFFVATDLALARERAVANELKRSGREIEPDPKFMPLTRKVALFATTTVLAILLVLFLVINKDLEWLIEVQNTIELRRASLSILGEMAFVIAVILAYVFNTIHGFTRNMRLFLDAENHVLGEATSGRLEGRVLVSSNDEFGVMASRTNRMVEGLKRLTLRLARTRDVTIRSLAILAETRDNETGAHIVRTQHYVRALAEYLRTRPGYAERLDEETVEFLFKSAPLHDIGKVGIPDAILLKPGKHSEAEFAIMKTHAAIGGEAIRRAEQELGDDDFLRLAREIAEGHHEKWDGSGYPKGLAGEAIPLSARLMAVADVYDALISRRIYKPAFPHEKARQIILDGRGSHFDPALVDAFLAIEAEFIAIAARFGDQHTQAPTVAVSATGVKAGASSRPGVPD